MDAAPFNAKAEAKTIDALAQSCLNDNPAVSSKGQQEERALAAELASIWGDKAKIQAVGTELEQLNKHRGQDKLESLLLLRIDVQRDPKDKSVSHITFRDPAVLKPTVKLDAKCDGKSVEVIFGAEKPTPKDTLFKATELIPPPPPPPEAKPVAAPNQAAPSAAAEHKALAKPHNP